MKTTIDNPQVGQEVLQVLAKGGTPKLGKIISINPIGNIPVVVKFPKTLGTVRYKSASTILTNDPATIAEFKRLHPMTKHPTLSEGKV